MAPQEPHQPRRRWLPMSKSSRKGKVPRRLRFGAGMNPAEILAVLREAKARHDHRQTVALQLEGVDLSDGAVAATILDLLRSRSARESPLENLSVEFCDGPIDVVLVAALLMEATKHLVVASAEDPSGILARMGSALRINASLETLRLLVPLSVDGARALGEALVINDSLEELSLRGSHWEPGLLEDDDDEDTEDDDDADHGRPTLVTTTGPSRKASELTVLTEGDGDEDDEDDEEEEDDDQPDNQDDQHDDDEEERLAVPRALADGLKHNVGLRVLDLRRGSLKDGAAAVLVRSLVGHPSLEHLDLSRNHCRNETLVALGELLGHPDSKLTTLDFREQFRRKKRNAPHSRGPTLDPAPLFRALMNNDVLEQLKLSHNRLGDSDVVELCRNLRGNRCLRELDLQWNEVTPSGLAALKGLADLPALRLLLLGGNALGREGNQMLAQLEDDDDSVCTILDDGRGGDPEDDDDDESSTSSSSSSGSSSSESSSDESGTYHTATSPSKASKESRPAPPSSSQANRFMGGLTGISRR